MSKKMSETKAYSHIQSLFGEDTVFHPNQIGEVDTFTTRSPALDRALGVGGWAMGRLYQLAGKPSSGKTFMALIAMAEWQSKDPENCCVFIDAEYTYDPSWAASLGVDNDRVLLVKTNSASQIFEGLCGIPKLNKKTKNVTTIPGILQMSMEGQVLKHKVGGRDITLNLAKLGVIVLDSVAVMQAPQEESSKVGAVNVAPLPRFLTTELKKLTPKLAKANVCFIAINHVKTKVGVMFGNPNTTPGGAAFKHACTVMLNVAPMSGADNRMEDENGEKYGHKIRVKVEKNKLAPPNKKAEFFIDFTSGVSHVAEQLFDVGIITGIIERPTTQSYIINGEKLTSKAKALEYIEENLDEVGAIVRSSFMDQEFEENAENEGKPEEDAENPFEIE